MRAIDAEHDCWFAAASAMYPDRWFNSSLRSGETFRHLSNAATRSETSWVSTLESIVIKFRPDLARELAQFIETFRPTVDTTKVVYEDLPVHLNFSVIPRAPLADLATVLNEHRNEFEMLTVSFYASAPYGLVYEASAFLRYCANNLLPHGSIAYLADGLDAVGLNTVAKAVRSYMLASMVKAVSPILRAAFG
jgi:hypothetical protein